VEVHTIIPALKRLRQEAPEFKASLGYIASSRAAWATSEILSQKTDTKKKKRRKRIGHTVGKKYPSAHHLPLNSPLQR
jgi:hypothetical protein